MFHIPSTTRESRAKTATASNHGYEFIVLTVERIRILHKFALIQFANSVRMPLQRGSHLQDARKVWSSMLEINQLQNIFGRTRMNRYIYGYLFLNVVCGKMFKVSLESYPLLCEVGMLAIHTRESWLEIHYSLAWLIRVWMSYVRCDFSPPKPWIMDRIISVSEFLLIVALPL